ncbi:NACHT domain-containing protein [Streptomyces ipomoeae]|uniref:NACHT domain-containing protein n=1 Tax=Streptomyces ipomoeae TaxID=103232 RepID=A0AAE8VUB1_9ACTN|nr:NACHT domain-containing protein [Streptomyces ipomoeae]TQE16000.1 NACHT domain-containing protein [Streptomyces ipomoeae]
MTGVRGVLRILGGAALAVALSVTANQVLSEGNLSWTWMYVSYAVAVASLLYAEFGTAPPATDPTPRGRRRTYLRQLRASVRDMETVGIATQSEFVFRMRQVYVDVSVVPQPLHNAAREPYLGSVSGGERRTLESVLREADRGDASRVLAVIGGPGSGKTTLARNTALELCGRGRRPWKRRLPVLLYLRDHTTALLSDDPPHLETVAVSAAWLEGKVSSRWLNHRLDRGGCVVLLDGLDEVADRADREKVVTWVARQIQRHPDNTYVITSRPHGYESNPLPGSEVLQVRRFTWQQIDRFLRQWSYATESRARGGTGREVRLAADRNAADLLARLRKQGALYDLAANPLLLTMTANVHRYRGQLPGSRAELYAEMADVLLHRRSEARGLSDATGLGGPHKQHVAQHLALAMMKARVRDWPVRDAARAIRRALRQVPGDVTAEVFLEEARKSGLLVERDHGVYGFAHLTLQEYLAAAQLSTPRADITLVDGIVDDPWWRETVLLWAAGNDATPVIRACLDRGSVPALALAFDCADQARTVDPDVRGELEALLAPPALDQPVDPARQRLLAGILATRTLRESIQLNDTTALCANAVPRALYEQFVHQERAAGLHHPDLAEAASGDGTGASPAVGMQAGDAERFVAWLNTVTEEPAYRLPAPDELGDPAAAMTADLTRHTVWAQDDTGTVLYQPPGVAWPYTSASGSLARVPTSDLQELIPYLELLGMEPAQRARVEGWARALSTAITRAPELDESPRLAPLELPLALATSLALDLALRNALDFAGRLNRTFNPPSAPVPLLAFDLVPDHDHVRNFNRVTGLTRALAPASRLSTDLGLSTELVFTSVLTPGLRGYSARDATEAALVAHWLGVGSARSLAHIRDLDPLAPGLDADFLPDRDHVLTRARTLDLERNLDPVLDLDSGQALYLGGDFSFAPAPLLALDIVLDRDLYHRGAMLKVALTALRTLHGTMPRRIATGPSVMESLYNHVAHTAAWGPGEHRLPEDPAICLRRARDLLPQADATGHLTPQTHTLIDAAEELLTAVRDRRAPSDPRVLACARTAILAALSTLPPEALSLPGIPRLLHQAWHSLAALDHFGPAHDIPNQILLIARTQP